MINFCDVEQISETLFKCKVCGYKYKEIFKRDCIPLEVEPEPYKCIHTGGVKETLDLKSCNCSSRGTEISIHKCNLYNTDCALLSLLKYAKKKELLDKGVRNCSDCPNRFDQINTEKGV